MNIITTIPEREDKRWVDALFTSDRSGWPIKGRFPAHPPYFPFSRRIARAMEGGYLYLVYRKYIIGYAKIEKHRLGGVASVGLIPEDVGPGDRLTLSGPLKRFRNPIPCVGFRNFRYTEKNLHVLAMKAAKRELRSLGLKLHGLRPVGAVPN
ncbi:MAG: hypothetical protein EOP84_03900 [Verrucomicrobiaceae bacterium]|nr:MAG: hypothetical protein EOP84_03900 [Verrucomicrobiaceae bacterium]